MADATEIKVVVTEFLKHFGASALSEVIFGKRGGELQAVIKEVRELLKGGKQKEAEALLEEQVHHKDLIDEMIMFNDMMAIRRAGQITDAELQQLAAFLNGLPETQRRKFREAHSIERKHTVRYANLAQFAHLNNADKLNVILGMGCGEHSGMEQLSDAATASNAALGPAVDAICNNIRDARPQGNFRARLRKVFDFKLFG